MKKSDVQTKPLTERQIFSIKRDNLERKIISYFEHSQNVSAVIEYAVAIMVRNTLILSDYSFMFQDLICELLLTAKPSNTLRRYCYYFKNYFSDENDWQKVINRLFKNQKEFQHFTKEARLYSRFLTTPGTSTRKYPDLELRLISIFEDAAGKKHRMSLRDMDETYTRAHTSKILEILTTLSVFKKADGTRRFAKFIKTSRPGSKDTFDDDGWPEELQEESVQIVDAEFSEPDPIEIVVPAGVDPSGLNESDVLALVQAVHPEIDSIENIPVAFVEEVPADSPAAEQPPVIEEPLPCPETDATATKPESVKAAASPTPAKKPKKKKPNTSKLAYRMNLIDNWLKRHTKE